MPARGRHRIGTLSLWLCFSVSDDGVLGLSDDELLALPRPPCPRCGRAGHLIPRIYGMPSSDDPLVQRAEHGEVEVEFAGCVIPVDPLPVWRCTSCDGLVAEDGTLVAEERQE